MPRDSVRLGPSVDDGHRPAQPALPVIELAFRAPIPHRRHDEVTSPERSFIDGQHRLRHDREGIEPPVRVVDPQLRGQPFRFVRAHAGGAERMASDVGPIKCIMVDKIQVPDARLRERDRHRRANRSTAHDRDRRACQPFRPQIMPSTVDPRGIRSRRLVAHDGIAAKVSPCQQSARQA
jgi:hypothetical protein